jgi:hypothetical protein
MAKSNYELLEENRESVVNFADSIKPKPSTGLKALEKKNEEVRTLVKEGKLSEAIQKLDEIKDNKIGIVWHESGDFASGTKALVRDARGVTSNLSELKSDAGEKYGMQILNEVRASIQLLDQAEITPEKHEIARQKLMFIANNAIENPATLNHKNIRVFNTQIVHVLDQANIEYTAIVNGKEKTISAAEQLNFAKETSNLHDEHKHIVTLTRAEDKSGKVHTVMEAEIMLNGLTDTQKEQYNKISSSKIGELSGVEWFDKMPRHKQNLLRDASADIASGTKVIPTQLLGDVVGVRNAYQKVTAIKGPGADKSEILSQTLHCGAPATKIKLVGKAEKQEIVNENIRQLQSFAPPGERINLNILNSKTPGDTRKENFIFKQIAKSSKDLEKPKETNVKTSIKAGVGAIKKKDVGIDISASPINKWRALGGGRDVSQFKYNLKVIGFSIETNPDLKNVSKQLKSGTSTLTKFAERLTFGVYKSTKTKAKNELENLKIKNPKLASDLLVAIDAKSLVDSPTILANSQNVNLELASKMNIVRNSVKNGALNNVVTENIANSYPNDVDFCKSGKDRTGYKQMNDSRTAVANRLGIDPQSGLGKKNLLSQVAGGHTQEMAGIQGGTTGCHSIKTNPEFGLNKQDKIVDGILNKKSSHFNSKIKVVKKESEAASIIADFEKSFEKYSMVQFEKSQNQLKQKSKELTVSEVDMKSLAKEAINMRKNLASTKTTNKSSSVLPGKPQQNKDNGFKR